MQQPLDYPENSPPSNNRDASDESDENSLARWLSRGTVQASTPDANGEEADAMTYATLLDRYESEEPITEEMIRQACRKMDAAQQFPFADGEAGAALSIRNLFKTAT